MSQLLGSLLDDMDFIPVRKVSISTVKPIVEKYKDRGGIVILFGDENVSGASYGVTMADCRKLRVTPDSIVDKLESGEVPVWD